MTREDAKFVLKDLCSRLPYGVMVLTEKGKGRICDINLTVFGTKIGININPTVRDTFNIDDVKPYLFPFSSMTEGQKEELNKKFNVQFSGNDIYSIHNHSEGYWDTDLELDLQDWLWFINWCYKNYFDIYGLISMGLAIDATGLDIY